MKNRYHPQTLRRELQRLTSSKKELQQQLAALEDELRKESLAVEQSPEQSVPEK